MTQPKILTFDGKKYDLDQLSGEAKTALRDVRLADGQIRMTRANLRVLAAGRGVLVDKLKELLAPLPALE